MSALSGIVFPAIHARENRRLWFVLLPFFLLFGSSLAAAQTGLSGLPAEFGKVIYRGNPESPGQLFIIAMAHRDALTGMSPAPVSRVQAEVYKLGEWVVRNEGCELLLPEGFFAAFPKEGAKGMKRAPDETLGCPESADLKTLEEKLSDNRSFVNAELLLKRNYFLKLRQVEDAEIHRAVGALIRRLSGCGKDTPEFHRVKSELDALQGKRTAAMLEKIPEIIGEEFKDGNIKARKAIFTIGLSHVPRIIRTLEEDRGGMDYSLAGSDGRKGPSPRVNPQKERISMSVLLPRSLAEDRKALHLSGLDENLFHPSRRSSAAPPQSLPLPRSGG